MWTLRVLAVAVATVGANKMLVEVNKIELDKIRTNMGREATRMQLGMLKGEHKAPIKIDLLDNDGNGDWFGTIPLAEKYTFRVGLQIGGTLVHADFFLAAKESPVEVSELVFYKGENQFSTMTMDPPLKFTLTQVTNCGEACKKLEGKELDACIREKVGTLTRDCQEFSRMNHNCEDFIQKVCPDAAFSVDTMACLADTSVDQLEDKCGSSLLAEYYKILGVTSGTFIKDIEQAYKDRLLPDAGGSKEGVRELGNAYDWIMEERCTNDEKAGKAPSDEATVAFSTVLRQKKKRNVAAKMAAAREKNLQLELEAAKAEAIAKLNQDLASAAETIAKLEQEAAAREETLQGELDKAKEAAVREETLQGELNKAKELAVREETLQGELNKAKAAATACETKLQDELKKASAAEAIAKLKQAAKDAAGKDSCSSFWVLVAANVAAAVAAGMYFVYRRRQAAAGGGGGAQAGGAQADQAGAIEMAVLPTADAQAAAPAS